MIHGGGMTRILARTIDCRYVIDLCEVRTSSFHQEINLSSIDQQYRSMQLRQAICSGWLHARVQKTDRIDAGICARSDRQEAAAGCAHRCYLTGVDFAL